MKKLKSDEFDDTGRLGRLDVHADDEVELLVVSW